MGHRKEHFELIHNGLSSSSELVTADEKHELLKESLQKSVPGYVPSSIWSYLEHQDSSPRKPS